MPKAETQQEAPEAPAAPVTPAYVRPPAPTFERQSSRPGVITVMYPAIIGGVCVFHGVINPNAPSTEQYLYCPNEPHIHPKYTEMIRCSYCPETRDPIDVLYKSKMTIMRNPDNWNKMIAVCDNFTCLQKHEARFKA